MLNGKPTAEGGGELAPCSLLLNPPLYISATIYYYIAIALGVAQVDPPSGSVIADFEGTLNATTLTCKVTDPQTGSRAITSWSLGNFRGARLRGFDLDLAPELFLLSGDPIPGVLGATYDNQMTILNLTSELDHVVLYCALQDIIVANFTLRIYRELINELIG